MTSVVEIEGIGPAYAEKLKQSDIATTEALLKRGASPQGRQEIAEKTGISPALILRWVNHADLFRVKGIGGQYAELLEASGVDTVPELAQRNPESLYLRLGEVNQEKKLVRRPPAQSQVKDWVQQAKQLARVVTY